jgi:enediyne biosynthesis protein E4
MPSEKDPDKSDPRFWNRLYHNNGNETFSDVTEPAGVAGHHYGMGVAVGDYDNDGHPDLYVTNFGANILYHNNGNGTFAEVTAKAGVTGGGWSTSACFVDYDRDGWLDLIVGRYVEWDFTLNPWCGEHKPGYRSYCHPDNFKPTHSLIYHNNHDGTFTDMSAKAGFVAAPGKALGVAFNDFDHDGWPDIVLANDEFPQQLFRNNQDGTFTETAKLLGLAFDEDGRTYAGMGIDLQDYDNDGRPDVFINALSNQKYALYKNVGSSFEYVSGPSGVAGISMLKSGWGAKFIDYDNDGWKDLFVAQGHVMDNIQLTQPSFRYLEPLLLMHNVNGKFEDVSKQSGPAFEILRAARGAGFGDLNNDGSPDIVVNCNNQEALVLRNEGGTGNHWLLLNPVGTSSNRDAIGAKIHLITESGHEQYALVSATGSYLSANDRRVHFGLGADKIVRLLEISWPSGIVQRLENLPADQILTFEERKTESLPKKQTSEQ